jgi:hypothetical protein
MEHSNAGEWRNDKKDGKGTLFVSAKNAQPVFLTALATEQSRTPIVVHGGAGTYVGLFENDMKSGLGTMTFPDGSTYKVRASLISQRVCVCVSYTCVRMCVCGWVRGGVYLCVLSFDFPPAFPEPH